jgi:hypothetical protein
VRDVAEALDIAQRPLADDRPRLERSEDFARRVALAERVGAVVLTDIKTGATIPHEAPVAAVRAEPLRHGDAAR